MDRPDEFQIISYYFRPLTAGNAGALDLLDDGAIIPCGSSRDTVVTMDTLIEGVHFIPGDPPDGLAGKLLAVNLSDLAAMAAAPTAYLLALSLPASWQGAALHDWLQGFSAGLAAAQAAHGIHLLGGDTVVTPGPLTLTLTAFGTVDAGCEVRRATACIGDSIYVSGTIGDAHLGLRVLYDRLTPLREDDAAFLVGRYRQPVPRTGLGINLSGIATAAADVSDGLVADLGNICRASGVTARIEAPRVPLSPAAERAIAARPDLFGAMITGGDDYEILFTARPETEPEIAGLSARLGLPLTLIGRIEGSVPHDPADGSAVAHHGFGGRDSVGGPVTVLDLTETPMDLGAGGYRHR